MNKNKITTIIIILITIGLATVAIVTGIKLYNISKKPAVTPKPSPVAEVMPEVFQQEETPDICQLAFNVVASSSPTPTPTPSEESSPTPTPSESAGPSPSEETSPQPSESAGPTPTPSPVPGCWDTCTTDSECGSSLSCLDVNGTKRCVNPSCSTESDCVCPVAAAPAETLISAGVVSPTLILGLSGLLLIVLGILL